MDSWTALHFITGRFLVKRLSIFKKEYRIHQKPSLQQRRRVFLLGYFCVLLGCFFNSNTKSVKLQTPLLIRKV